jgi:hypothetical protein
VSSICYILIVMWGRRVAIYVVTVEMDRLWIIFAHIRIYVCIFLFRYVFLTL